MEVPLVCSKVESYNITYWPAATQLFYWLRNFEFCSYWHTILILESTLPTYKKVCCKTACHIIPEAAASHILCFPCFLFAYFLLCMI